MLRRLALLSCIALPVLAPAQESVRYVSDELAIVLRESTNTGSPSLGTLLSGTRLELLESDPASGYARVRLGDGREGWVQERFLTVTPIARERAERAEKKSTEVQAELKTLREEHAKLMQDFARITAGQPPPPSEQLLQETESLRQRVQSLQQELEGSQARQDGAQDEQRTLLVGGGLVAGGFTLAWLLHWLWPKRRWGDL